MTDDRKTVLIAGITGISGSYVAKDLRGTSTVGGDWALSANAPVSHCGRHSIGDSRHAEAVRPECCI